MRMTDEQHGHYIRALMMADRLIEDGPEKRDWRLSFGRLFEGRRESPIPEDVGTEVEYVLRSRVEAARRAIGWALAQDSRRSLEAALAALGGDDTRVDLHLPEPQLHRSEPPLNRLEPGFEPRLNRSEPSLNRSEPGVVQGAFLPAQSLRQLLEALHIGLAAAHEVTILFHADMRGYRGDMHRLHEDREQQVLEALKLVQLTINQMAASDEAAVG
jgi:hypothetical protein